MVHRPRLPFLIASLAPALLALLAAGSALSDAGASSATSLAQQGPARVLVSLREPPPPPAGSARPDVASLRRQVAAQQAEVLASLSPAEFELTRRYQAVPALAGRASAEGLAKLSAHPEVVAVSPDLEVYADLGESVPQINADDVHGLGATGEGVVVAVLDSGIDTDHPDLADDLLSENCFLSIPGPGPSRCHNNQPTDSGPGSAEDDHGHGSHVSGIITSGGAVAPVGVAPDAGIRAYKVLNDQGEGLMSDVLAAADHIIANHPDTDLVNLSLSDGANHAPGTCEGIIPALDTAFATLRSGGTTVVVSSGNGAFKDGTSYPACLAIVVSAGAVYDADLGSISSSMCEDTTTAVDQVVCFSNSDSSLDLLAPGCITTSSVPGGGTAGACGTSMAAPHAVGVGALALEGDPALTPDELEVCLKTSAALVTDAANGITRPRVDALAAFTCASGPPVGGVAAAPEVARSPQETTDPSDGGVTAAAGLVAAATAGAIVLGSAAWCARRRRPGR